MRASSNIIFGWPQTRRCVFSSGRCSSRTLDRRLSPLYGLRDDGWRAGERDRGDFAAASPPRFQAKKEPRVGELNVFNFETPLVGIEKAKKSEARQILIIFERHIFSKTLECNREQNRVLLNDDNNDKRCSLCAACRLATATLVVLAAFTRHTRSHSRTSPPPPPNLSAPAANQRTTRQCC